MTATRLPIPLQALLLTSIGALAGMLIAELWVVATAAEQPLIWWLGRASGFVAYGALWLSMLFGIAVSSKGVDGLLPKKLMMDLHQQWTLSAVIATAMHAGVLVLHAESGVTPWAVIAPFASARLTGPVALGTFAVLGLGVVIVSSWLRGHLSYRAWRAIHGLAFGTMILALAHGWTAGTDTAAPIMRWLYIVTAATTVGALVTRIGVGLQAARSR